MMHLQYSNTHINKRKVRLLIRAGCDLKTIEPYYYTEIESEVMHGLIEDRMVILKLAHSKYSAID